MVSMNMCVVDVDVLIMLCACVPQEAAEGRTAHSNVWNGANGMVSTYWKPCI